MRALEKEEEWWAVDTGTRGIKAAMVGSAAVDVGNWKGK